MASRQSFHIDAPVKTVYEFMKDPTKWRDVALFDMGDVKVTEDGPGTLYDWRFKIAGIPFEGFEVITDVVPNRRITERSSRAFFGTWIHTFEREGSGTKWTMVIRRGGLWRIPPLSILLDWGSKRMGEYFVPRVRAKMETAGRRKKAAAAH